MKLQNHLLAPVSLVILHLLCPCLLNGQSNIENRIFEEINGLIAVEAEHFAKQSKTDVRSFRIVTSENHSSSMKVDPNSLLAASNGSYLKILPDTRRTHDDRLIVGENFSNEPGKLAILSYLVHFNTPGRYYVWARAYSTGTEDNGLHVGLDGEWPESGQRLQWCEGKNQWWWESRQRTQKNHCGEPHKIYLDIENAGEHTIQFSMREDGFQFDRWLMTKDRNFNRPLDAGPKLRLRSGSFTNAPSIVSKLGATKKIAQQRETNPGDIELDGEFKRWHKVTLVCTGPETSENASPNPFLDYRLNATFTHSKTGKTYEVPGYFAADGNAAESSADSGNQWHVHFSPDETGRWEYDVDFRKGPYIAVSETKRLGQGAGYFNGTRGWFDVSETDKQGVDFRAKGRLQYVNEHYLRFAGTGEYFLKCGADAPENLLAYKDFDGDFKSDGHGDQFLKDWAPHVNDWREGDATWKDGKGKGLIGALNYLASHRMNAVSFLTMNIKGDDKNVFPYTSYDERERFDVSKLAQWEQVFEHAQKRGLFLHFKTQEHENQGLLDGGGVGLQRKLYYRELIARFGHHLALNWNLGEENGEWGKQVTLGQDSVNRRAMAEYFFDHDPYRHLVVIHNGWEFYDLLGSKSKLTGVSVQTNQKDFSNVHGAILKWRRESAKAEKPWVVSCDEPGDAQLSLVPDNIDPTHDNARINALWGTIMGGGAGIEWYFGYKHAHSDLSCQDWRSREKMWIQCQHAIDLFAGRTPGWPTPIPFHEMKPNDSLISKPNYCMHHPKSLWMAYLKKGGNADLNVASATGPFFVTWFNPRSGKILEDNQRQEPALATQGKLQLVAPDDKDWLAIVRTANQ